MLDRYWSGETSRVSAEAPIPVVHVADIEDRPGGAGNVALNIATLGASARLVGAVGDDERRTAYSEWGTCVAVVAPSDGGWRGVVTADLLHADGYGPGNVTDAFGGTSAAAPMAAGVVALMLAARPPSADALRLADVREVLARTARRVDVHDAEWVQNDAALWFSPWYGFGLVDADAAVRLGETWERRPDPVEACGAPWSGRLPLRRLATRVPLPDVPDVRRLDAVRLRVDLDHPSRGDVEIELASPRGTPSRLTRRVTAALHDASFVPHWYTSLAFLGEASGGDWEVRVTDATARGTLRGLQVCVSGTPSPPASPPPPRANSLRPHLWAGGGTLLLGLVATFLTRRRGQKKNQSPSE